MNDNLHRVRLKAQALAHELACERNGVKSPQQHTIYNEFVKVYADMLLRECMALAQQVGQEYRDLRDINSADAANPVRIILHAGQDAADIVQQRIRDHFGVDK